VKKRCMIFVSLFLAQAAHAVGGGSPYSLYGIGDLRYVVGVRSAALGHAGIALAPENSINGISPASWTGINRTRVEAGLLYEGFTSSDASTSLRRGRADFNGALFAIPIAPSHGIVFVAGFTPYSGTNYDIYRSGSSQGVDYTVEYVGKGGLSNAQAGLSYAPRPDLALGASINYLFGTLEQERTFFTPPEASSIGTTREKITARGLLGALGLRYSGFGAIHQALDPLSLGFVIRSRASLTSEHQTTYEYQSLGENDTSQTFNSKLSIPLAFGIGLAYQAGPRYVLAADYYAQAWSTSDFFGTSPEDLRNSSRIGFGGERIPNPNPASPWLDRLAYRLGFYYNATYFKIKGEPINEWAVTGGLGIPLGSDAVLNVGLEYGSRGTNDNNLVKERILRISASLSISELWFVRFAEE
jgi:hypothetical protein